MRAEKLSTEVRQDQIARAALQLIAAEGVQGLSLAAIARRVGLVPSAIYRHYRSKGEVLDATIDHLGARLLHNLDLAAGETPDPLDRLHDLLKRHVALIRENQAVPRFIFSETIYGRDAGRKEKVRSIITRYMKGIAAFVREGQASGRIRPDVDPDAAAVHFLGLILPSAVLWHLTDGRFDVTRQAERAWSTYRAGLEIVDPAAPGRARRVRSRRDGRKP
jgi:AcrR family transcriptional regulator